MVTVIVLVKTSTSRKNLKLGKMPNKQETKENSLEDCYQVIDIMTS